MKNRLFACTFLISLFLNSSAFAYIVCHDYTVFKLTDEKVNPSNTKVKELRERLQNMEYKRKTYKAYSDWRMVGKKLTEGDIFIIGDAHSGIFKKGLFYNYTQEVKLKDNEEFNIPGKKNIDSSLAALMDKPTKGFVVNYDSSISGTIFEMLGLTKTKETITLTVTYPYKDKPVEVWHKNPNKQPKQSKKSASKQYKALCAIGTEGIKMFVWDASGRRYGCQDRRMKLSNFSARKTPIIVGVRGNTGGKEVDCPIASWPYKLHKVKCVSKNSHSPMKGHCAIYSLSGGKTKHCYYVEK